MNSDIEYEKFTQEVYQKLVNADVVKTTEVKHDIKLTGKSGQEHQIDVYWEYEIAGVSIKLPLSAKTTIAQFLLVKFGIFSEFYTT
mgnify:CR=1 FL=1